MDINELKRLLKGFIVIIDDEIENEDSEIYRIKENFKTNDFPVVEYKTIPSQVIIDSFLNASFIVMDWNLIPAAGIPPITFNENKQEFVRQILKKTFCPVFIFTTKEEDEARDELDDDLQSNKRIFIKKKADIEANGLFDCLKVWIESAPSAYVFKEWESLANRTMHNMFIELYEHSPGWVQKIWKKMKLDNEHGAIFSFGDFISKNFNTRLQNYKFESNILECDGHECHPRELSKVLECERYMKHNEDNPTENAYTGDLFSSHNNKYLLNIRAQCDIARESDPILYLIEGEKIEENTIRTKDITPDCLKSIITDITDNVQLQKTCTIIKKHYKKTLFLHGTFIEKANEKIIGPIDSKFIKFDFTQFEVRKFSELKDNILGRILAPHINQIQQKFSQYIVRQGVMPVPEELFADTTTNT
ncbi:MAG: hypothetical protein FWD54_02580 [Endomicrobia bacterium]|nr:hypothetical protein [Endomicrobiia bacterium]